jgi:ATP-binding cassette, subfamily B, multidrug efflux pump
LKANKTNTDHFDLKLLYRIFKLAFPFKKQLVIAVVLTIVVAIASPIRPMLVQWAVDNPIANGDLGLLTQTMLVLVGVLLFQSVIQFFHTWFTNFLGQNVIRNLRVRVFNHLIKKKLAFYDKTPVGTLVTRSVTDIETIAEVFSEGVITISGDVLQIVFITIVMFVTDWKLSLICLSVLPVLLIASNLFRKGIKSSFNQVRTQVSRLNAFVQEHLTGMSVVQIFNREEKEYQKFREINKGHLFSNKKSILYYAIFFPVVEIITAAATGLLVWYGTANALNGEVTPGVMISFIMYINMFFRPVRMIADRFNTIQMGMVAAERIFKLLDDKETNEISGDLKSEIQGNVEFQKVWFAYVPNEYVLKDISFTLNQGKTLALVGATGAGKTSIINLLSRFYEIADGQILIDGMDVKEWDLTSLRSQIAVVMQDVFLFSGSVSDNIDLSTGLISKEKMMDAAKSIGAEAFIDRLPEGWDYKVMERGQSLSVGQRQLISFIRALAFDPKILILDEATSSVDSETEELIQEAIKKLMKGRTSIVIAHRLSTIQNADEILVLRKGKIEERGNHQSLIDQKGYYYQLQQNNEVMA